MTEAIAALAAAAAALGGALAWLAWRAARADASSPQRLVAELRLAQVAALLLTFAGGVRAGAAVAGPATPGAGLDVALATGLFVVAALATTWEPPRALAALAAAWIACGLLALGHNAGLPPAGVLPAWYPAASAIYAVCMAGVCYSPALRRR